MTWSPNTREETQNYIQRGIADRKQEPRRNYELAVVLPAEDRQIRGCSLGILDLENHEGEIGYILNRDFWGQGYGTETATALLRFGFEQLDLHRIVATCDRYNIGSARVLEKVGMRREGHFVEHKWEKGKWCDSYYFAMLLSEWAGHGLANPRRTPKR